MYLRKTTIVRLITTYKIMMLLGMSNDFSAFVNKDRALLIILVEYINDAMRDCAELNVCASDIKKGLKSKQIVSFCNNIIMVLDLMKERLRHIRDIITTNGRISSTHFDFNLASDLMYYIDMLYRFISKESEEDDE